jgi:iron complex transport system substrate-binding protein
MLAPRAFALTPAASLQRVVALDWGLVQTLLALGLAPIASAENELYRDSVREPQLPPSVQELGLRSEPNLELLQQLQPELIMVGSDQGVLQPRLNAIAPTEIFADTRETGTPAERVAQLTLDVATRIGRVAAAEHYLADAWQTFASARARCAPLGIAPLQVISVIDERRALVFGQGSLFDDVLRRLGLRNAWTTATNGWGYATIGFEQLAEQPDAQLAYFNATPGLEARLTNNPLWRNLPSVRAGRAIKLPEVLFYGGMPSAVSFAQLLAQKLPEVARA